MPYVSRRSFVFRSLSAGALPVVLGAPVLAREDPIELSWSDLVPKDGGTELARLRDLGVVQHGEMSTTFDQDKDSKVTDAFNGKLVRLPGYLVPLEYRGTGVVAALLVPYVGACVHVPPPPANQLVFVTIPEPYEIKGLFEPVYITGMFGTAATETQLAEVGYALTADRIDSYDGR